MIYKKIPFILLFVCFSSFSQVFKKYKITEDQLDDSLLIIGDNPIIITSKSKSQFQDFITHKLKRKQTLEEISKLYNVSKEVLISFNNYDNKKIKKGIIIKIPISSIINKNLNDIKNVKQYKVLENEGKST